MLKVINHFFKSNLEKELLHKFKYIIFESNDIDKIKIIMKLYFLTPDIFQYVKFGDFKFDFIEKIEYENLENTLFISNYQILWSLLMNDYFNYFD